MQDAEMATEARASDSQRAASSLRARIGLLALAFASAMMAAVLIGGALAQAKTRSATFEVSGSNDCFTDTRYEVALPPRAIKIRAQPKLQDSFFENDSEEVAYVSRINGTDRGSKAVRWVVTSNRCDTFGPWSAGLQTFTATFETFPRRPPLSKRRAVVASKLTLQRKFGNNYNYAYAKRLNCKRKLARNTRRCKVRFVIGDLSYRGVTRVSAFSKPNTSAFARVRYRIKRVNEYCVVTGGSGCTTIYRGRTRVHLR